MRVEDPALEAHALRQRGLVGAVDRFLGHHRDRAATCRRSSRRPSSASSTSPSAGTIRETRPARSASAASIMRPVRHISIALALPTNARQPLAAADAGHHAELDLRLAELRGVGGQDQVAHHGEFAAAAEGVARHRRDDRRPQRRKRSQSGEPVAQQHVDIGRGRHLLDVGARREGLRRPGDDDAADARIARRAWRAPPRSARA